MQQQRITPQAALQLCQSSSFCELGEQAGQICRQRHGDQVRTYVIERNINYTNVCLCRCSFCAFSVSPADALGYVLDEPAIADRIEPLVQLGGNQILLQGGMNPDLDLPWYENLLHALKASFPGLHVHGFSPPELLFLADRHELTLEAVLDRLRQAGLDTIPGGGAEILVDRVRKIISPAKCSAHQWLDVMRRAHQMGISTTATMMFGHVETLAERIEHLDQLRRLQDESLNRQQSDPHARWFTAFTCWPFQSGNTRLGQRLQQQSDSSEKPDLKAKGLQTHDLKTAGAFEQLKMTALARIYLDNFDNIQASWVTQGPKIGQISLLMGCNDLGSLMMEENVVSAAGTSYQMELTQLRQIITDAGFSPVQRDCYYRRLNG